MQLQNAMMPMHGTMTWHRTRLYDPQYCGNGKAQTLWVVLLARVLWITRLADCDQWHPQPIGGASADEFIQFKFGNEFKAFEVIVLPIAAQNRSHFISLFTRRNFITRSRFQLPLGIDQS